jgi:DNA-directed RNA polymerase subunit N (RpoN/RPB10)
MYVVCLDCGKEFAYDWQQMKVVQPDHKPASALAEPARSYATK